ncbi:MAG: hypothetical protein KBF93_24780 [Leptospiraceae bacterium]|nr:hypothetical protein [Leptospiraceae bacterium]
MNRKSNNNNAFASAILGTLAMKFTKDVIFKIADIDDKYKPITLPLDLILINSFVKDNDLKKDLQVGLSINAANDFLLNTVLENKIPKPILVWNDKKSDTVLSQPNNTPKILNLSSLQIEKDLRDLAAGKKYKVLFNDSSSIERNGNGLIFYIQKYDTTIKLRKKIEFIRLNGMEDFKFLMEKSFFNKQTLQNKLNLIGIQELLRDAIPQCYEEYRVKGGNAKAENRFGGITFNYENRQQAFASDAEFTEGKNPFWIRNATFYSYNEDRSFSNFVTLEKYLKQKQITENLDKTQIDKIRDYYFCNQLNCKEASKINLLKSAGLLRPDLNIFEAERILRKAGINNAKFASGYIEVLKHTQKMIEVAKLESDWAKLTGANRKKLQVRIFRFNDIDMLLPLGYTYMTQGGTASDAIVSKSPHEFNIVGKIKEGLYKCDDPIGENKKEKTVLKKSNIITQSEFDDKAFDFYPYLGNIYGVIEGKR